MAWNWNKTAMFVGGLLTGTAGISILSGEDAKKVYTHCAAAVMRGRDRVMEVCSTLQANGGDIAADAADINEKRKAEKKEREIEQAKAVLAAYEEEQKA